MSISCTFLLIPFHHLFLCVFWATSIGSWVLLQHYLPISITLASIRLSSLNFIGLIGALRPPGCRLNKLLLVYNVFLSTLYLHYLLHNAAVDVLIIFWPIPILFDSFARNVHYQRDCARIIKRYGYHSLLLRSQERAHLPLNLMSNNWTLLCGKIKTFY